MRINELKINAFRGIPKELELKLKGKSLLLLGENGTGKSSVIDAIEFFFTSQISHLKKRGPLALKDHGPNAKNPEKASVTIVTYPENHSTTRTFNSNPSFQDSLLTDFNLANNGNFILRRSQILDLINATSSDRYKFISRILGVDELESIDTAMFRAKKDLIKDVELIEDNIEKTRLLIINELEIEDFDNILVALNKLIETEGIKTVDSFDEIEECINKLDEIIKSSDYKLSRALSNIFDIIKKAQVIISDISHELADAENYKKEIIKSHDLSELSLIKILKKSLEIIDKESEECPLCENKVNAEELLQKINQRLDSLESLKENRTDLKNLLENVREKLNLLKKDLIDLSPNIAFFDELKGYMDDIDNVLESFVNFQRIVVISSFLQDEFRIDDFKRLENQIQKLLNTINEATEELKTSIKPSKRDERLNVLKDRLYGINEKLEILDEYGQKLKVAKKYQLISEIIYSEFSDIKKRKIQEVYNTIQEDVERYYAFLHPHESYGDIKIGVDPNKKGSTDLRMTIFGKEDKDPRSLSSEGHLDSLGLCIFLALFKKVFQDFPLLVLDDVVTTMDSRHRENVCQLLFEEFRDKQFIITTHDNIWFEQLRAAQRVYNLGNQFNNSIIIKWNEDSGPEIEPYKARWDKIEASIENGDKYCAGNEGRRYLEWLLKDICNRTMANIPAKYSGKYEVGDLIQPAKSRLLKLVKEEEYKENIENAFKKLDWTIMMGNLLSHDNLMAGTVSIDEVERFCLSIHEIHELMLCSECKAPLGYYRDLKIMRCSNKNCSKPMEIKTR